MTNSFSVFSWDCWGSRASKGGQRRKCDFEGSGKGTSTSHACSSWFYNAQASPLPWPCPSSVLQMGTYRSGVPCPTSEATVWSWSCWKIVSYASVYNKFFSPISLFNVFFFTLFYSLSSLTLGGGGEGGAALCLNFGPSSELGLNEGVVPLLLVYFRVFFFFFFFFSFINFLTFPLGSCFILFQS